MNILFLLKKRNNYHEWNDPYTDNCGYFSSGLYNSVKFIVDMLKNNHIDASMLEVIDGNYIDKVVYDNRPKVVILEALWVTPDKLAQLVKLHPRVKWVVRIHSEIPFLANEGIAFDWLSKYIKLPNTFIAANSASAYQSLRNIFGSNIILLPNYYPTSNSTRKKISKCKDTISIGCFGAIRPMKNQLMQAVAAINFANKLNKKLIFYINASRTEQKGDKVLQNIEALFNSSPKHTLIKYPWMSHEKFKKFIKRSIDISMQVSFSETFNIVSADSVDVGVPVVASSEISFVSTIYQANPTDEEDIIRKLEVAYHSIFHHFINKSLLNCHNKYTIKYWKYLI